MNVYLEYKLKHGFVDGFTGSDQQVHLGCLWALVEGMPHLFDMAPKVPNITQYVNNRV